MKIIPLRVRASVTARNDTYRYLKTAGDAVLVERGEPRWLMLCCPCGCGEIFPINLDSRAGPAWVLYRRSKSRFSIFPSVWRESGCRSHYVIWRSQIFLFDERDGEFDAQTDTDEVEELTTTVLRSLPVDRLISFSELAKNINAIPWDVLTVCRRLTRRGLVEEGRGKQQGTFRRLIT